MRLHRSQSAGLALLAAVSFAACSSDPVEPAVPDETLATALDGWTAEATQAGDIDASSAFASAALAVRLGIRPTPIAVQVGGQSERYLAFVHVVSLQLPGHERLSLRTLVAVQGEPRPDKVLVVSMLADQATLGRPTTDLARRFDLAQLAWASWRDRTTRTVWVGAGGQAGISEQSVGGECPKVSDRASIACVMATFGVFLDGVFHARASHRTLDPDRRLEISTRADHVNGAVLTLTTP